MFEKSCLVFAGENAHEQRALFLSWKVLGGLLPIKAHPRSNTPRMSGISNLPTKSGRVAASGRL